MLKAGAKKIKSALKLPTPLLLLVVLALFVSVMAFASMVRGNCQQLADSADSCLVLEYARTEAAKTKGLSGREKLGKNHGLLFVFDQENPYCFWMKDMRFAIDIIWLDADKRVVHVQRNAEPESYPSSFCPDAPARYVLEVNAGMAEKAGFTEGVQLNF